MTTKLRAEVYQDLDYWIACVALPPELEGDVVAYVEACDTHAEAITAAHKLLADVDAELMAEVHASRAARRTEKAADDVPAAAWRNYRSRVREALSGPAAIHHPRLGSDPHTMEATA